MSFRFSEVQLWSPKTTEFEAFKAYKFFPRTDRQTDRQTDQWTDLRIETPLPEFKNEKMAAVLKSGE